MRPISTRRIAVLVPTEDECRELRLHGFGNAVLATSAAGLRKVAQSEEGPFDLVFVALGEDAPDEQALEGLRELSPVVAGVVTTDAHGAAVGQTREIIAAVRSIADFVVWSPDKSLLGMLCDTYS